MPQYPREIMYDPKVYTQPNCHCGQKASMTDVFKHVRIMFPEFVLKILP